VLGQRPGHATQEGVANVHFKGVPLGAVLEKHGVSIDPQVKYVTAEGEDLPMGGEVPDMEHSLPVADVLAKSIPRPGAQLRAPHDTLVRPARPSGEILTNIDFGPPIHG
jgi:hypothetical protein